jgi:hypothetical protein
MFLEIALAFSMATHAPALPDLTAGLTTVDYILPVQRVVPYGAATQIINQSTIQLSPDARVAFDQDFAVAPYFGAFAVSKDGGWGYSVGTNSLGAAREIALQECLAVNSACTIHSEIVPVGYVPIGPGDVTMNAETARNYADTSVQVQFYAMAISADGAYAQGWEYASQAEADAAALADCETYRIRDLPISDMPCVLLPRAGKK